MDRREFITTTAIGAMAMSFNSIPEFLRDARMGVVVHSYGSRWNSKAESKKYPGFKNALDLIEHCAQIKAGGVQVGVNNWSIDFGKQVRDRREKLGLYLEGSITLPKKVEDISAFEKEVISSKEAGAKVLRTVCLNGRRYEAFQSIGAFHEFKNKSIESLQLAEPIVRKHKMKLAIENHKDWRAKELAGLVNQMNSEWIGVTIDFGNSIALIEDPMEVVTTLLPYVFSTHVKDMAVDEYTDGFLLSEVPLGEGIVDLSSIVAMCQKQNAEVNFSLEMITRDPLEIPCLTENYWATFENISATELARTMRMVKKNISKSLPQVSQLSAEGRLEVEEKNVLACLQFSYEKLNLK